MSSDITISKCSSCQHPIRPEDKGTTKLNCPECGVIQIIRCSQCRAFGNTYICHACGFQGP